MLKKRFLLLLVLIITIFSALISLIFLTSFSAIDKKKVKVETDFRITIQEGDNSAVEGLDKDIINILLLGTDSDGALNYGRSDTMIICSIHKKTGLVQLSSIARDLYIDIPNSTITDRINTANSYGGPLLAVKAVNETFGLNIEHYVTINFSSFEYIVEVLGGVDIEITSAEATEINKTSGSENRVSAGLAHIDGKQALAYVRIRKLDNTFGRNNRQRIFLESVVNKVLSEKKIDQIVDFVKVCLEYVDHNLNFWDITTIAWTVLLKGVTIDTYSCPGDNEYYYKNIEGKGSVVIGKMDIVCDSLHSFIYGQE